MQSQDLYFLGIPYQGTDEEKAYRVSLSIKAAANFLRQGAAHICPRYLYQPDR